MEGIGMKHISFEAPCDKINVIRELRAVFHIGLRDAKNAFENGVLTDTHGAGLINRAITNAKSRSGDPLSIKAFVIAISDDHARLPQYGDCVHLFTSDLESSERSSTDGASLGEILEDAVRSSHRAPAIVPVDALTNSLMQVISGVADSVISEKVKIMSAQIEALLGELAAARQQIDALTARLAPLERAVVGDVSDLDLED
jgi:hypothetical protein